jgi:hypothetical protein
MVFSDCGIGCICGFVGIGVGILGNVNGTGVGVFVVNNNKSLVVLVIDEVGESDSSIGGGVRVVIGRLMCWKFRCLRVWLQVFIVTNNTPLLFFSDMCLPYAFYFYLSKHEFTCRNT